jgi:hypothetical protein
MAERHQRWREELRERPPGESHPNEFRQTEATVHQFLRETLSRLNEKEQKLLLYSVARFVALLDLKEAGRAYGMVKNRKVGPDEEDPRQARIDFGIW